MSSPECPIPGVMMVRDRNFPTPVEQFTQALKGRYFPTVSVLFGQYPELRPQFEELLLAEDLRDSRDGKTESQIAVAQQLTRLEEAYHEKLAADGMNNNKRFTREKGKTSEASV